MIEVLIGTNTDLRAQKRGMILKGVLDVIVLDDMTSSIRGLEEYAYPSLFSLSAPVVHGKFLIETSGDELTKELLQTLVGSPTLFLLEEHTVGAATIRLIEKEGGIIHQDKPAKKQEKPNTIFGVTAAITAANKKDRWLAWQSAIAEHAPEALIGILYWKLRQLIGGGGAKNAHYRALYRALMRSHKSAWQNGSPLALAIEKVIIEQ